MGKHFFVLIDAHSMWMDVHSAINGSSLRYGFKWSFGISKRGVRWDAEQIILTIAMEVEKPDECLEIYPLIDVLRCGNRGISRITDDGPLNYYKNNAHRGVTVYNSASWTHQHLGCALFFIISQWPVISPYLSFVLGQLIIFLFGDRSTFNYYLYFTSWSYFWHFKCNSNSTHLYISTKPNISHPSLKRIKSLQDVNIWSFLKD